MLHPLRYTASLLDTLHSIEGALHSTELYHTELHVRVTYGDVSSCNKTLGGFIKMNTALEYSTRVVQEGGRRCKKSTLNDLL